MLLNINRHDALNVHLDQFEGPLALLLYLIRKEEMDINNIQIHVITKQYLDYIQTMKKLDLEVASEFITMAATLIHIKSKVLLPQYDELGEEIKDDPRKELVNRLKEYQKFQEFAKQLVQKKILNRDVWRRGYKEDILLEENQEVEIDESGLFGLISAYRNLIKAAQKRVHKIMQKSQSIASRIIEMKDLLIPGEKKVMLALIRPEEMTKNKLLLTFLSMLELAKMGFVKIFQTDVYSDIYVETMKVVDRDVVQRVESYDGANAELQAQKIISESQKSEGIISVSEANQLLLEQAEQVGFEFPLQSKGDEMINDSATDEEISSAERELGIDIDEAINPSMEPIEDIKFEIKTDILGDLDDEGLNQEIKNAEEEK